MPRSITGCDINASFRDYSGVAVIMDMPVPRLSRRCHPRTPRPALLAGVSFKLPSTAMATAMAAAASSGTNLLPYIAVLICSRTRAGPVIPDNSLRVYNERPCL